MKKITIITSLIVLAIIILILKVTVIGNGSEVEITKEETECIAKEATLYMSESCIYCTKQEKMFGDNYQYLNKISCKLEPGKCLEADITGTPTWVLNDGTQLVGVQELDVLKRVTNCA